MMITNESKNKNKNKNKNGLIKGRPRSSTLRLQPTRSKYTPCYKNSELMRLGIGGVYTDYDINYVDIDIENGILYYKNEEILIPNIKIKPLNEWSSLEVCSWLLSIEKGKYSIYLSAIIENNVNGQALHQLKFVTIMKLTRYEINVNDCLQLLKSIKSLSTSV